VYDRIVPHVSDKSVSAAVHRLSRLDQRQHAPRQRPHHGGPDSLNRQRWARETAHMIGPTTRYRRDSLSHAHLGARLDGANPLGALMDSEGVVGRESFVAAANSIGRVG
jgi:hypothetical protein